MCVRPLEKQEPGERHGSRHKHARVSLAVPKRKKLKLEMPALSTVMASSEIGKWEFSSLCVSIQLSVGNCQIPAGSHLNSAADGRLVQKRPEFTQPLSNEAELEPAPCG